MNTAMMEELAKGEALQEESDGRLSGIRRRKPEGVPAWWLYILAVVLIFSLVANLFLALK